MDKKKLIMGALCAGTLLLGGVAGANLFPVENTVIETVDVEVEKIVTVVQEVPVEVEVPVNVTVEVPVDNGNLDIVLEHIYDNEGQIEYLLDDLDDDELDLIVNRIAFINEVKQLGAEYIESELADELDDYDFNGTIFDDDDIEDIDVDDDADDIEVNDVDFDDDECNLIYSVKFEHDDVDYIAEVEVEIKDGEADELNVLSVELDE